MLDKLEILRWLKNTIDANFDKTGFFLELKKQTEIEATKYSINKKLAIEEVFLESANDSHIISFRPCFIGSQLLIF